MKNYLLLLFVFISALLQPIPAFSMPEYGRTCLEGQENAQLINARDSVDIYRYESKKQNYSVVMRLPVGEHVAIVGDTTETMLHMSVCDSVCYVDKQYVSIDSLAFSTGHYTARNEMGLRIPLKWFFIALIVAAIANLLYCRVDVDDRNPFIAFFLYLLLNGILIATCLCHSFSSVIENCWTGGWWNGYLLSFLNSCGLLLTLLANKRACSSFAKSAAYECLSLDDYEFFSPSLLFWSPLLILVAGGVCQYFNETLGFVVGALVFLGIFIYTLYCFGRHFLLGILIFVLSLATFGVCCIIFRILFNVTFILGVLAILALTFGRGEGVSMRPAKRSSSDESDKSPHSIFKDIYVEGRGWLTGKEEGNGDVNVDGEYFRKGYDGDYHSTWDH